MEAAAGRSARSLCRLAVLASALGLGGPAAGAPSPPGLRTCASSALALVVDAPISPQTGENAQAFALMNRGPRACVLIGYPRVALMSAGGRVLRFRYRHGGGYVSAARPRQVRLRGDGGRAYFVVAKYRCDLGVGADADAHVIWVRSPNQRRRLSVAIRTGRYPTFSYCRHPGGDPRSDNGDTVTVSPLGASIASLAP